MMFLTAYAALIFDAQVKAGDFVIIPAASSSVGLAAIQLTNYAGAIPIALSALRKRRSGCTRPAQHRSLQPRSKKWSPR